MKTRLGDRSVALARATIFSWLAWLLAVAVFAIWTLETYHAPAAPAWFGMTVRTTVFAIWTLLARDWLGVWLARRGSRKDLSGHTDGGGLEGATRSKPPF
jgi:hypothetical protein